MVISTNATRNSGGLACSSKNKSTSSPVGFRIKEAQAFGADLLRQVGIDTPELDMRLLLQHVLRCSQLDVFLQRDRSLSEDNWDQILSLLRRRLCFEPMAYLTGVKEFFGHELLVNSACLIPRPDTEVVVEHCLKLLVNRARPVVFDIATGSGAIAIALLKERPDLTVVASDISQPALKLAGANAERLEVRSRLTLLQGDLFEPFVGRGGADVIVSNPPYLGVLDYQSLSSDVKNYEPAMALVAGDEHGLAFYSRIFAEASDYLVQNGFLVLEIGFNQGQLVADLVSDRWKNVQIFHDLAARPRVVVVQKA